MQQDLCYFRHPVSNQQQMNELSLAMGCQLNSSDVKHWLNNLIRDKGITRYQYSGFEVQNECMAIKESSNMVILEAILESQDFARLCYRNL